jgi:hypothetical protein
MGNASLSKMSFVIEISSLTFISTNLLAGEEGWRDSDCEASRSDSRCAVLG